MIKNRLIAQQIKTKRWAQGKPQYFYREDEPDKKYIIYLRELNERHDRRLKHVKTY